MQAADRATTIQLMQAGYVVESYNASLLHEPETVRICMSGRWSGHFGTLMPFVR